MPTYEYKCTACKHEFEEFQSMADDSLVKCPECGKRKLVRIISGAGLVFKGSGFYLTDYKNRGTSPDGNTSVKSPAPAEKSGSGKGGADSKKDGGEGKAVPASDATKEKPKKSPSGDRPSGDKT